MKRVMVFALLVAFAFPVQSQDYPARPIRMLVPFAPGGAVDTAARVLAQAMQQRVNWQFVIENRPGGNGFIATTAVAKAAPDGYTLLMAHTGEFAVNPAIFDKGALRARARFRADYDGERCADALSRQRPGALQ